MGGLFGYTFLAANEDSTNVTFMSFLLDPTLDDPADAVGAVAPDRRHRARHPDADRAQAGVEAARRRTRQLSVNGAQGMFETRFGVGVVYRADCPSSRVFTSMARMNSEKKEHFYADITRDEWLFGAAFGSGPRSTRGNMGRWPCSA